MKRLEDNMKKEIEIVEPKVNGKAIASLVIGIVSLVIPYIGLITGIIGIVLANSAFKVIKNEQQSGRALAIAGLVCSIIATALYGLIILFLIIGFILISVN